MLVLNYKNRIQNELQVTTANRSISHANVIAHTLNRNYIIIKCTHNPISIYHRHHKKDPAAESGAGAAYWTTARTHPSTHRFGPETASYVQTTALRPIYAMQWNNRRVHYLDDANRVWVTRPDRSEIGPGLTFHFVGALRGLVFRWRFWISTVAEKSRPFVCGECPRFALGGFRFEFRVCSIRFYVLKSRLCCGRRLVE